MKFAITTRVILQPEIDPNHLLEVLQPENQSLPDTKIVSKIDRDQVSTTITGIMKLSSLNRTIDDILQTAYLTDQVAKSTMLSDIQDHEE